MNIIERNGVKACLDCGAVGMTCCENSSARLETSKHLRQLCERLTALVDELRAVIRKLSKGAS